MEYEFRCNTWLSKNDTEEESNNEENEQKSGGKLSITLKPYDPNQGSLVFV